MIWGKSWLFITFIAVLTDLILGEFPGKHPVEYLGDFINWYQKVAYKKSVLRGAVLVIITVIAVGSATIILQKGILSIQVHKLFFITILGVLASIGLAGNTLKKYVRKVINTDDPDKKRENLSFLVTRNTKMLDDKKVYSSLIETHAENLSDGYVSPLFYLILFGLPGIAVFKTISTLDSMIGYKNEKYEKFGKVAAIADDILNYIPSRLTAIIIWLMSKNKVSITLLMKDAISYSTSPNAGFPITAAAYNLGVKLGGPVYYEDRLINKAEIGQEIREDYKQASLDFIKIHSVIEKTILLTLFILIFVTETH